MLNIYLGPMYSGKTTELISNYYRYRKYQQLVIDYDTNNLDHCTKKKKQKTNIQTNKNYYEDKLVNHNHSSVNCIKSKNINVLLDFELIKDIKIIHINEAQFFSNLKKVVLNLVEFYNITVYLYGLDGDFRREKFGEILDLIPYCNNITKLKGVCNSCDNEALFSHRIVSSDQQFLINSENETTYIPLCRDCYNKPLRKQ